MGNVAAQYLWTPGPAPVADSPPSFDPLYGFPQGRKERVMIATEQEMKAAKIPLELRDYCAHLYLDFLACQRKHYPWNIKCAHEKHLHNSCEAEDYVLRMKEFERERRLLVRQQKKEAAAQA